VAEPKLMSRQEVQELIAELRSRMPEQAEKLQAYLDANETQHDGFRVNATISYKLEKFDGEYEPGKQPVEVLEGTDTL
jgi:hypothetical protein